MMFFDQQENQISPQVWLRTYEPYYFLNGPTFGQHINGRNQTSPFVENQVCALLRQTAQLSTPDLIRVMAWKIGLIDHHGSEAAKNIKYMHDWPNAMRDRYGRDFSGGISSLATTMATIVQQVAQGNPQYLFDLHSKLDGFGPVYVLTVLFFISHGAYPIYDQYAHVAAQAIQQGLRPGTHVKYKNIWTWGDYKAYMNLLALVHQAFPQPLGSSSMFIPRHLDRALWVYGHFFRQKPGSVSTAKPCRTHLSALATTDSTGVLVGRVRDLCQSTSDGWRRREIIVRQSSGGYPTVRNNIHLIDSSGAKYHNLPFVKGAGVQGYSCLGRPGALRSWFTQHYPINEVKSENVYFKPTGQPNEFRL